MIYTAIRATVILIAVIIIANLSKNNKIKLKNKRLILILLIALNIIINIYPVENLFVTFNSPESLLAYKEGGRVKCIAESEDTALIYYKKDSNTNAYISCLKNDGGYKISRGETIVKMSNLSSGIYVVIYQVKGTNDYYACVRGIYEENISIEDSNGKKFELQALESNVENKFIAIELIDYTDNYCLFINGERVYLSKTWMK